MLKDFKTATIWGVILWVAIFVLVSILMFTPALQGQETLQLILQLLIMPFLVVFCAYMYFNSGRNTAKEGFLLGIWFLILGTILDLIITVPLFVKSYSFFLEPSLWIGYFEGILFCTLTGYFLKKSNA